jgi:hypothetical protein
MVTYYEDKVGNVNITQDELLDLAQELITNKEKISSEEYERLAKMISDKIVV